MVANIASRALVVVDSNSGAAAVAGAGTAIQTPETLADAIAFSNGHPNAEPSGPNTITFASKITGIALTAPLDAITATVQIYSPSTAPVTIDGGGSTVGAAIFTVNSAEMSVFDGLKLIDGDHIDGDGGAVDVTSGGVALENSILSGDSARAGGAVFSLAPVSIGQSTFAGDQAEYAPAVLVDGSTLTINASTVSGNVASIAASAVGVIGAGTLTITDSTIADNTAPKYGAIFSEGRATLDGSTIVDNDLTGSATQGAGLYLSSNAPSAHPSAKITSSIIAQNSADEDPDVYPDATIPTASFSLIGDASGSNIVEDAVQSDILGSAAKPISPKLGKLRNNGARTETMMPLAGSPVIDKGLSTGALDQAGNPRDVDFLKIRNANAGDGTDIGSVEVQAPFVAHRKTTGTQRASLWTPSLTTAAGSKAVPVKFSTVKVKGRKQARFVKVQLRVDKGGNTTVKTDVGSLQLSIAGKKAGTHTAYARFTYTEKVDGHKRTVVTTVSGKFKIR